MNPFQTTDEHASKMYAHSLRHSAKHDHQRKAISKGLRQHTPIDLENKERNRIYRKNLKQSHINHLHGIY